MIEQTQKEGNKPWFGGDLVSLQQETLMPLQALFQEVGNIIIQGCRIEDGAITAGFVGIYHADGYKVAQFDGVTPEQWPVFLLIEKTSQNRKYGDDQVKPVSYTYKAKAVYAQPQVPYIRLNETNNTSYYLETILADAAKLSKANRFAEIQQFDKAVGIGKAADEGAMLDVNGLSKLMGVVLDSFASRTFVPGMTGDGASLDENGNMEVNSLLVRKDMTVFELIVQKLRSVGGMLIVSVANGSISAVENLTNVYRVTLELGDNVSNPFVVNDLVKCQKFNGNVKYYWRKVVAVGATTIDLSKTDADGSGVPEPGDSLVQLGHATDVSRQNAIIIDATAMPKIDILEGITTFSLTNKVKSRLGDLSDFGITGMGLFTSKGKFTGSVSIGYENISNPPDLSVYPLKTYVDSVKGDLQSQIDGVVDSWFYNYIPSLVNAPASDWTTTDLKQRHVGDTFTNTQAFVDNATTPDAGKSWRWVNNSGVFSWTPIADSDAVKALIDAAKAQDTADGKRRVFIVQPTPPYDLGDLWSQGTAGDLMKCKVAKAVGTSYAAGDWEKASKYTDDTAAIAAQTAANNAATAATAAQTSATAANNTLAEIADDNKLSPPEKQQATKEWNIIISEKTKIDAQADVYGISKTAYATAYSALSSYITPLVANLSTTDVINGATFRTTFKTYYDARQDILNAISTAAKTLANAAQTTANSAATAAAAAQNSANAANESIGSLNSYVDGAFKDGVIDSSEAKAIDKLNKQINIDYDLAVNNYNVVYANAYLEGTAKTDLLNAKINLVSAKDALQASINTAIADGKTTPTEKADVDSKFATYATNFKDYQTKLSNANKAIQQKLDAISKGYVDAVQIGGRNLYKKTTAIVTLVGTPVVVRDNGTDPDCVNGFKIAGASGVTCGVRLQDVITKNGSYVISFWGKSNGTPALSMDIAYNNVSGGLVFSTTWKKFVVKVTVANYDATFDFLDINNIPWVTIWVKDFKIEEGTKETDWSPAPEDVSADILTAQTAANNAATAATAAQTSATAANNLLAEIADDNKLSPTEKQQATKEWNIIISEKTKIDAQADTFSVSKFAYGTAYSALSSYITPLLANLSTTDAINGATFRANFKTYYDARQDILNAISTAAKTLANTAQSTADNAALLAKAMNSGKVLYPDPNFRTGYNGINVYNNSGGTAVTVVREAASSDSPNGASGFDLNITYAGGSLGTSPGLGGFRFATQTRAGAIFVVRFIAKIPNGYYLTYAGNSIGTGASTAWLTSNQGSGSFQEYVYLIKCGTSGTFSTSAYFALNGTATPGTTWRLAMATVYDITDSDIYSITASAAALADMAADGKLTPAEKLEIKRIWLSIQNSYSNTCITADEVGWAHDDLDYAFVLLAAYINPLLSNMTITSPIVRDTFDANINNYLREEVEVKDAVTLAVNSKVNASAYLSDAIKGSTDITGGLVATNLLLIKDILGIVTGGLSGLSSDNTGIWTGGTYEQALTAIAKIILRKDGSGQLAGGKIKFDSMGELLVGNFTIENGSIIGYSDNVEKIKIHTDVIDSIAEMDTGEWQSSGLNFKLSDYPVGVVYDKTSIGGDDLLTLTVRITKQLTVSSLTNIKLFSSGVVFTFTPEGAYYSSSNERFEITGVNNNIIPTAEGVIKALSAGTYDVVYKLSVTFTVGDTIDHYVYATNNNARIEIQRGVERTEIGKNGFLSYFGTNNFLHFTQLTGLQVRGTTNMPGILATGSVTSGASHVNKWGAKTSGNAVTKGGTGVFIVPHSVGSITFTAIASCTATGYYAAVTAKASGSITVTVKSDGGVASDQPFDYVIMGAN